MKIIQMPHKVCPMTCMVNGLEDLVDPRVGQTGPGGVVDADEIGLGLDPSQRSGHRIGTLRAAVDHFDSQDRDVRGELEIEILAVLRRDHQDGLHDIVAVEEPLGRVQPDGDR